MKKQAHRLGNLLRVTVQAGIQTQMLNLAIMHSTITDHSIAYLNPQPFSFVDIFHYVLFGGGGAGIEAGNRLPGLGQWRLLVLTSCLAVTKKILPPHLRLLRAPHLNGNHKVSSVAKESVGIQGYDPGLVWLGHISKDHIHHR